MKRLTTLALGLLLVAFATTTLTAQQARVAVGVRAGLPTAVSAKAFVTETIAVELNGGIRGYKGFSTTNIGGALFFYLSDHGMNKGFMKQVSFYGGLGLGRSYYKYDQAFTDGIEEQSGRNIEGEWITSTVTYDAASTNMKAYIGAQYLLPNSPFELTVDFGPDIHIGKIPNSIGGHASVGVRYILLRQKGAIR